MSDLIITGVKARQILDSRGNPTVEADVYLNSGAIGRASVPSGASTGSSEALELRDNNPNCYGGKSVFKAVWNINGKIRDLLVYNSADQDVVDHILCDLDGTSNKSHLGANATLAVSLATAKAVARTNHQHFYEYIAELSGTKKKSLSLPMPMMNVMNGGAHSDWSTDFQEYMIVPKGAHNIAEAVQMGAEVFHALKDILKERGYPTTVGDEGGYAPRVRAGNIEPLECIKLAVAKTPYKFGEDIMLALDIASSEFFDGNNYAMKTSDEVKTSEEMISWYDWIIHNYPVISIEDGLSESDWSGWKSLTEKLGDRVQLVGDDLFVTNTKLLSRGIEEHVGNAILIKPNQIGTLSETIAAVKLAKDNGYRTVISHRSGETEDTSIAHLAVGLGAGQIKTGSLSRSERICKYNELIRISEQNKELPFAN